MKNSMKNRGRDSITSVEDSIVELPKASDSQADLVVSSSMNREGFKGLLNTERRSRYSMNYQSYEATRIQPGEQTRRMLDYMFPGYQKRDPRNWYEMQTQTELGGLDINKLIGTELIEAEPIESFEDRKKSLMDSLADDTSDYDESPAADRKSNVKKPHRSSVISRGWEGPPIKMSGKSSQEGFHLEVDDFYHEPQTILVPKNIIEHQELKMDIVPDEQGVPKVIIYIGNRDPSDESIEEQPPSTVIVFDGKDEFYDTSASEEQVSEPVSEQTSSSPVTDIVARDSLDVVPPTVMRTEPEEPGKEPSLEKSDEDSSTDQFLQQGQRMNNSVFLEPIKATGSHEDVYEEVIETPVVSSPPPKEPSPPPPKEPSPPPKEPSPLPKEPSPPPKEPSPPPKEPSPPPKEPSPPPKEPSPPPKEPTPPPEVPPLVESPRSLSLESMSPTPSLPSPEVERSPSPIVLVKPVEDTTSFPAHSPGPISTTSIPSQTNSHIGSPPDRLFGPLENYPNDLEEESDKLVHSPPQQIPSPSRDLEDDHPLKLTDDYPPQYSPPPREASDVSNWLDANILSEAKKLASPQKPPVAELKTLTPHDEPKEIEPKNYDEPKESEPKNYDEPEENKSKPTILTPEPEEPEETKLKVDVLIPESEPEVIKPKYKGARFKDDERLSNPQALEQRFSIYYPPPKPKKKKAPKEEILTNVVETEDDADEKAVNEWLEGEILEPAAVNDWVDTKILSKAKKSPNFEERPQTLNSPGSEYEDGEKVGVWLEDEIIKPAQVDNWVDNKITKPGEKLSGRTPISTSLPQSQTTPQSLTNSLPDFPSSSGSPPPSQTTPQSLTKSLPDFPSSSGSPPPSQTTPQSLKKSLPDFPSSSGPPLHPSPLPTAASSTAWPKEKRESSDQSIDGNEQEVDSWVTKELLEPAEANAWLEKKIVRPAQVQNWVDHHVTKPASVESYVDEKIMKPASVQSYIDEKIIKPTSVQSHVDVKPARVQAYEEGKVRTPSVLEPSLHDEVIEPAKAESYADERTIEPASADSGADSQVIGRVPQLTESREDPNDKSRHSPVKDNGLGEVIRKVPKLTESRKDTDDNSLGRQMITGPRGSSVSTSDKYPEKFTVASPLPDENMPTVVTPPAVQHSPVKDRGLEKPRKEFLAPETYLSDVNLMGPFQPHPDHPDDYPREQPEVRHTVESVPQTTPIEEKPETSAPKIPEGGTPETSVTKIPEGGTPETSVTKIPDGGIPETRATDIHKHPTKEKTPTGTPQVSLISIDRKPSLKRKSDSSISKIKQSDMEPEKRDRPSILAKKAMETDNYLLRDEDEDYVKPKTSSYTSLPSKRRSSSIGTKKICPLSNLFKKKRGSNEGQVPSPFKPAPVQRRGSSVEDGGGRHSTRLPSINEEDSPDYQKSAPKLKIREKEPDHGYVNANIVPSNQISDTVEKSGDKGLLDSTQAPSISITTTTQSIDVPFSGSFPTEATSAQLPVPPTIQATVPPTSKTHISTDTQHTVPPAIQATVPPTSKTHIPTDTQHTVPPAIQATVPPTSETHIPPDTQHTVPPAIQATVPPTSETHIPTDTQPTVPSASKLETPKDEKPKIQRKQTIVVPEEVHASFPKFPDHEEVYKNKKNVESNESKHIPNPPKKGFPVFPDYKQLTKPGEETIDSSLPKGETEKDRFVEALMSENSQGGSKSKATSDIQPESPAETKQKITGSPSLSESEGDSQIQEASFEKTNGMKSISVPYTVDPSSGIAKFPGGSEANGVKQLELEKNLGRDELHSRMLPSATSNITADTSCSTEPIRPGNGVPKFSDYNEITLGSDIMPTNRQNEAQPWSYQSPDSSPKGYPPPLPTDQQKFPSQQPMSVDPYASQSRRITPTVSPVAQQPQTSSYKGIQPQESTSSPKGYPPPLPTDQQNFASQQPMSVDPYASQSQPVTPALIQPQESTSSYGPVQQLQTPQQQLQPSPTSHSGYFQPLQQETRTTPLGLSKLQEAPVGEPYYSSQRKHAPSFKKHNYLEPNKPLQRASAAVKYGNQIPPPQRQFPMTVDQRPDGHVTHSGYVPVQSQGPSSGERDVYQSPQESTSSPKGYPPPLPTDQRKFASLQPMSVDPYASQSQRITPTVSPVAQQSQTSSYKGIQPQESTSSYGPVQQLQTPQQQLQPSPTSHSGYYQPLQQETRTTPLGLTKLQEPPVGEPYYSSQRKHAPSFKKIDYAEPDKPLQRVSTAVKYDSQIPPPQRQFPMTVDQRPDGHVTHSGYVPVQSQGPSSGERDVYQSPQEYGYQIPSSQRQVSMKPDQRPGVPVSQSQQNVPFATPYDTVESPITASPHGMTNSPQNRPDHFNPQQHQIPSLDRRIVIKHRAPEQSHTPAVTPYERNQQQVPHGHYRRVPESISLQSPTPAFSPYETVQQHVPYSGPTASSYNRAHPSSTPESPSPAFSPYGTNHRQAPYGGHSTTPYSVAPQSSTQQSTTPIFTPYRSVPQQPPYHGPSAGPHIRKSPTLEKHTYSHREQPLRLSPVRPRGFENDDLSSQKDPPQTGFNGQQHVGLSSSPQTTLIEPGGGIPRFPDYEDSSKPSSKPPTMKGDFSRAAQKPKTVTAADKRAEFDKEINPIMQQIQDLKRQMYELTPQKGPPMRTGPQHFHPLPTSLQLYNELEKRTLAATKSERDEANAQRRKQQYEENARRKIRRAIERSKQME